MALARPSRPGPPELPPTIIDHLEHGALRAALALFRAIPRDLGLRLGAAVGGLLYALDPRDRGIALKNLALALPDRTPDDHRRIVQALCRNLGRMAFEITHMAALTPANVSRYVQVDNPERWQQALARVRDRGAIILTGHFGNWELLAYACGLLGYPVTLVHRPMRNRLVDAVIDRLRAGAGTRVIAKKAAAKEAFRQLRQKALVAIPFDQNQVSNYGVFVDFFGIPACTTFGPARLALMTGAPIIPVFLVRDGESERHRIVVLPEIDVPTTGDREMDVLIITQRCSAAFERMVRAHPEQWIWFHKRWKTRPAGAPRLY